jgi:hypothetical protein
MNEVSSNISQEVSVFEKLKEQIKYKYQSYERGPSLLRVCDMTLQYSFCILSEFKFSQIVVVVIGNCRTNQIL